MTNRFILGVAQSPADLVGSEARLDWLDNQLVSYSGKKVDMLLLPELFATGYNIGDKISEYAEKPNGPIASRIKEIANRHDLAVHYGYAELSDDKVFNSAQCIGPSGDVLGTHRKLILPPGFEADHFAQGQGTQCFDYRGMRFGTLICYDAEFAETARHVAMQGAQVLLVPTALGDKWEWVSKTMIPTRGYENGMFLAYANSAGHENGMDYLGQSFISQPNGSEAIRAGSQPEIIIAELDVDLVAKAQARLPYLTDRTRLHLM